MNTIGKRIQFLRKKRNITQKQLAEATNINQGSISRYEKDEYKPSSDALSALSKFFNVSVEWIMEGGDETLKIAEKNENTYSTRQRLKELGPIKHNDGTKVNSRDKHKILELLDGSLGDLMYNQEDVYKEFTDEDMKLIEDALVSTFLDIREIKRKERLKKAKQEKDQLEAEIERLEKELNNDKDTKGE